MKKLITVFTLSFAATGCAVSHPIQYPIYNPPPNIVYVQPYYPAPYANMTWIYMPRMGWGWHHPHHGFHHRNHYRLPHYR